MKTNCSSRRLWSRRCCKSIPFIPGIRTSTTTHAGPGCCSRARKSDAEPNASFLKPAERNNRDTPLRTDASSSIKNTRLFVGLMQGSGRPQEEQIQIEHHHHRHFQL